MSGKMTRRAALGAAGAAVAAVAAVRLAGDDGEAPFGDRLRARRIPGPIPADDPSDPQWSEGAVRVALLPQNLTTPGLAAATVSELTVSALRDEAELGLRLSWSDEERDDLEGLARFQDAVAVQIPVRPRTWPPITMGGPGAAVHVLQWRAGWQRDIDEGRAGVADVYPNVVRDLDAVEQLGLRDGVLYSPGLAVGNPMSARARPSPVGEAVAEGFGSLTHLAEQRARGRGVWTDGVWAVSVAMPLDRRPAADAITPGLSWPVAFAVWSGSAGDRGGRKQYAEWISLSLAS
jgi:hypothetical protein